MPILNLRNTAGEFEPIPAMIGPQGAQGVPGPNEITTATATPLSGVLVGEDNYVREGERGVDFAAPDHAHGNITSDGKVGSTAGLPLFTDEGGAVGTKTAVEALTALGLPYEAGTWTPIIHDWTNGIEYSASAAGSYIKLAEIVIVSFVLANLNISSVSTAQAFIGGLPFAAQNQSTPFYAIRTAEYLDDATVQDWQKCLGLVTGSKLYFGSGSTRWKVSSANRSIGGCVMYITGS